MTLAFRPQPRTDHALDRWELVRRWPGMRGEDKLAWKYLWDRSRAGLEETDVKAIDIAQDQGVTSDAGLVRIKNLDKSGLVRIVRSDRRTGVYTLEMLDPVEVSRARSIKWDGQFQLPFMEESETAQVISGSVATVTDCAPACVAISKDRPSGGEGRGTSGGTSGGTSVSNPSNPSEELVFINSFSFENPSVPKEGSKGFERSSCDRGSAGGSSASFLGDDMPLSDDSEVEFLAERIKRRVRCKNLRTAPCLKAARAVVDGVITHAALERILEAIEALHRNGASRAPPSVYFNTSLNKLLAKAHKR